MPSANELDGNHLADYVIMNPEDKWTALPQAIVHVIVLFQSMSLCTT